MVVPKIWLSSAAHDLEEANQCDCNCDCACPTNGWPYFDINQVANNAGECLSDTKLRIHISPKTYIKRFGDLTIVVAPNSPGIIVFDQEAQKLLSAVQEKRPLNNFECLWPAGILEKMVALLILRGVFCVEQEEVSLLSNSPDRLVAWLHLTNQCSLACPYCYVTSGTERMNPKVALDAVAVLFRMAKKHGYKRVKIKYAGGEPTLNFKGLQVAQLEAEHLSKELGVGLGTTLLTNAIHLSDHQIEFLAHHKIKVMVSLDGVDYYHNVQRPLKQEENNSFALVDANLTRLLAAGITPYVSITLTRSNLNGLPDLIDFLLDRNLRFGLNFYRSPNLPTLGIDPLVPEMQDVIITLMKAFQRIEERLPNINLLSGLADRVELFTPHNYTCGVGQNYLVVDCNGKVTKCQMELDHPITDIWAEDPLAVIQQDQSYLQNLPVDLKQCNDCIWYTRCTGGCPRLVYQQKGGYDARSPICEIYQTIIPEIVRLETQRLVRFEKPLEFC